MNQKQKSLCPICASDNTSFIGTKNEHSILRCIYCSHIYANTENLRFSSLNPEIYLASFTHGKMPTDREYYNHLCLGERPGSPTSVTGDLIFGFLRKHTQDTKKTLLDVGSGSGYIVKLATDIGYQAEGIEPGEWGQIAAQEKQIKISKGFLDTETQLGEYDIITATDVLEHVQSPIPFLKALYRNTKKDGYIFITIPYASSLEAKTKGLNWDMLEPPTHNQFFTKDSLKYAMNTCNLEIIYTKRFNIRSLKGLFRYRPIRVIYDFLIPGSQIMCVARPIS